MSQTSFDSDANTNGSNYIGERASNIIKGLGAYFAGVLTNISLIVVVAMFISWKALEKTGLLSFLAISILLIIFYSIITTKTANGSINYKATQIVKRIIDVVVAALGLFFLMPLFILLSVAIRIESPGPILFRSRRIGQFGKLFDIYKFRTMYLSPVEQPITKVGKFLRRFHINELPTLVNVLNGEMSIVGPSPRQPEDIGKSLDSESKILSVRPGITGLGEVSMASGKDLVSLDLKYVQNWSLALDIRIFFKTLLITFFNSA